MLSRTILTALAIALAAPLVAAGAQSLSGPYVGRYTATLTRAQAAAKGDSRLAGKFTLWLTRNGTYVSSNSFDRPSQGRLAALSNHRLRFYDDVGCKDGGFERPGGGIYRWSLNDGRLTLRLVSEGACTGRRDTLTFPVWKRK